MKKKIILIIITVLMAVVLAAACIGCSSGKDSVPGGSYPEKDNSSSIGDNKEPIVTTTDRLVVYYVDLTLSVDDDGEQIKAIKAKLKEVGGYEASSYASGSRRGYYSYTFKVPTEKLDEFVNSIESNGNVTDKTVRTEDITDNYTVCAAKKKALQEQYDSLKAMLEGELTVEEKLKVNEQLMNIAAELDKYDTIMSNYKNKLDYSTVNVYIYQNDEYTEPSYWDKLGNVLSGSAGSVGTVFGYIFMAIVAVLPYFAILCGLFGLYVLIKAIVCKVKKKPFTLFKKHVKRPNRDEYLARRQRKNAASNQTPSVAPERTAPESTETKPNDEAKPQ